MTNRKETGFTLIEVLIAMTILAVLSVFTADSVQRSLRMKAKIQKDVINESKIRNAIRVIERDINLAFQYRNIDYELRQALRKNLASGAATSNTTGPLTPGVPPTNTEEELKAPKVLTGFVGENSSLHFTTLSHVRLSPDSKESDQEEVGYFVAGCPSSPLLGTSGVNTGNCLFRRSSPYLDGELEDGGTSVPILSNVKKFNLRYIGQGKQDWVSQWRSDDLGDDATKGKYPQAVEVELEVDFDGKALAINTVVPLRFPNNRKKTGDANGEHSHP